MSEAHAEASLIGAMLLSKEAVAEVAPFVSAGDFKRHAYGHIFDAITELWRTGEPIDEVTVTDLLRRRGLVDAVGGPSKLVELMAGTPSTTSAGRYGRIIVEAAGLRRLMAVCADIADQARDATEDLDSLIDRLVSAVQNIATPKASVPDGLWSVDGFLERPDELIRPWVLPGLFREGWRAVCVADEGAGKTMVAHQLALCAAQGIHPFALEPIPKVTSLLVDLENPDERIAEGFSTITGDLKQRVPDYAPHQAWLWHRPGGIDVRRRADRARLEAVIETVRPKLVCIGPIYKLYAVGVKESDELAARECMAVLDDLRVRYGFGLFLEHHAPKKQAGVREMTPYGSSLWLRWPEFGIALTRDPEKNKPKQNDHYNLGRFRLDRVKASWPSSISKSAIGLPWAARWDDASWRARPQDEGDPF